MLDKYNREINYLRVSVTDRCNLRCLYCMPESGIECKSHDQILRFEKIEQIVKAAVQLGITKIRLTGGEPLVRKGIANLVSMLSRIDGIKELTMTTNGILLSDYAKDLKEAGLGRVNISLDSINPEKYSKITRGGNINRVLLGIDAAIKHKLTPVKLNVVLMDINVNELDKIKKFADSKGIDMQVISEMTLSDLSSIKHDVRIAQRPLPCRQCNRIRLTADGYLKPCLFSSKEIEVDFENISESIMRSIKEKPKSGTHCENRYMFQIGG